MASYQQIIVETRSKVRVIRLSNPKRKNALNKTAYRELAMALWEANADPEISTVALTGTADFFSSGNDMKAFMEEDGDPVERVNVCNRLVLELVDAFICFEKLLIAVCNGPSIGIATTILPLCDVVYATKDTYFLTPFTNLALCAEGCSSLTFPRILGQSKASEMLLLGEKLTAEDALKYNFVSRVFKDQAELNQVVWSLIQKYSELPMGSLMVTKKLMRQFNIEELKDASRREMAALKERYFTPEVLEATMNFITKGKSKL